MANKYGVVRNSFLLALGIGTVALLAGCQSANGTTTAPADHLCPMCQGQMRSMPITGGSYAVHSCPSCQRVSTLDEATRAALERAYDVQAGPTVHQCDRCGVSSACPVCRREMT